MSPVNKKPSSDETLRDSQDSLNTPPVQAPDDSELRIGDVLAQRYRVVEYIGRGGMGSVYRAHDLTLGADIAIKTLDPELIRDEARREGFRSEVKLARLVTHRNVCRLHDIVELPDVTFITMELIEGESLAEFLSREPQPPLRWTVQILRDVARGLAAAHAVGVIHRDLKPGNVLLADRGGRAVVADFGIAAQASRYGKAAVGVAGTRGFMSPEQTAGVPLDARSDVFALGVLAHLIATGHLPTTTVEGDPATTVPRDADTVTDVSTGPEAPAFEQIPRELVDFVGACLEADPADRPGDAAVALRLLETAAAAAGEPTVVTGEPRPEPRGPSAGRRAAGVGLVVLGLLAGGLWTARQRSPVLGTGHRIAVGEVSTIGLEAREAWLADAVEQRVLNELIDAWGLDARKSDAGDAVFSGALARDAAGRLEVRVLLDGADLGTVSGDSVRAIAAAAAARIAGSAAPANVLRPTAEDLRSVGTTDPEAWRLLWRGRREARMQQWEVARTLFAEAIDRDPGFPVAWLEIAFTHDEWDRAYHDSVKRAVDLAPARPGMSELSQLGIAYGRAALEQDRERAGEALKKIEALDLEPRDRLYVLARRARAISNVDVDEGEAMLEWLTEQFPNDAGAYKELTAVYLDSAHQKRFGRAVSRGARAVALAPDDVGARADYARALALSGNIPAARAHMEILESADPAAKMHAFSGGELRNSLFRLHLTLGELDRAERDVLRLMRGSPIRRAQGRYARGLLSLQRGDVASGLDESASAAGDMAALGMNGVAASAYGLTAVHAWEAGEVDRAIELYRQSYEQISWSSTSWRLRFLEAKRDGRLADPTVQRQLLESSPGSPDGPLRVFHDLLLAYEREDWQAVGIQWARIEQQFTGISGLYYAGRAADERGDASEAERLFEKLVTAPTWRDHPVAAALAWVHLGVLREARGDNPGAREAYETFLSLWTDADPAHPAVRKARTRLASLPGE